MKSLTSTVAESRACITRARELRQSLAPVHARSRALIARSRQLRRERRRISGGSDRDISLAAEILGKSGMCVDCLARKTGVPSARLTESLERIGAHIAVAAAAARCEECLRITMVYRIAGAGSAVPSLPTSFWTRQAGLSRNEALWRLLEAHRGEMFCTQCIATALGALKRIDRAIMGAEGRGARRRYGACAKCGKDRLLCGLGP